MSRYIIESGNWNHLTGFCRETRLSPGAFMPVSPVVNAALSPPPPVLDPSPLTQVLETPLQQNADARRLLNSLGQFLPSFEPIAHKLRAGLVGVELWGAHEASLEYRDGRRVLKLPGRSTQFPIPPQGFLGGLFKQAALALFSEEEWGYLIRQSLGTRKSMIRSTLDMMNWFAGAGLSFKYQMAQEWAQYGFADREVDGAHLFISAVEFALFPQLRKGGVKALAKAHATFPEALGHRFAELRKNAEALVDARLSREKRRYKNKASWKGPVSRKGDQELPLGFLDHMLDAQNRWDAQFLGGVSAMIQWAAQEGVALSTNENILESITQEGDDLSQLDALFIQLAPGIFTDLNVQLESADPEILWIENAGEEWQPGFSPVGISETLERYLDPEDAEYDPGQVIFEEGHALVNVLPSYVMATAAMNYPTNLFSKTVLPPLVTEADILPFSLVVRRRYALLEAWRYVAYFRFQDEVGRAWPDHPFAEQTGHIQKLREHLNRFGFSGLVEICLRSQSGVNLGTVMDWTRQLLTSRAELTDSEDDSFQGQDEPLG